MKTDKTAASKAVTFKALQSPKQFFSFKEENLQFHNGFFTTENPELIAFLEQNHACERVQ